MAGLSEVPLILGRFFKKMPDSLSPDAERLDDGLVSASFLFLYVVKQTSPPAHKR